MTLRRISKTMSECMLWAGYKLESGYGRITVNGKQHLIHRLYYQTFVGEIPQGLTLDHLCNNPPCFNPDHLEPVTLRENLHRGKLTQTNFLKTHCPYKHPYSGENLRITKKGYRECKKCHKNSMKKYYKNKLN